MDILGTCVIEVVSVLDAAYSGLGYNDAAGKKSKNSGGSCALQSNNETTESIDTCNSKLICSLTKKMYRLKM